MERGNSIYLFMRYAGKHAERPLVQLKHYNSIQKEQLELKQHQYWLLYQELKRYKENPTEQWAIELSQKFDSLCVQVENYESLNQVLDDLQKKKEQLLVVLDHPNTSLHNNDSERDIREYAKRRKISAGNQK